MHQRSAPPVSSPSGAYLPSPTQKHPCLQNTVMPPAPPLPGAMLGGMWYPWNGTGQRCLLAGCWKALYVAFMIPRAGASTVVPVELADTIGV